MEENAWSFVKNRRFVLVIILLLGLALRIVALTNYPRGYYPNEALIGYRACCLANLGKDELGRKWPLFFTSPSDYQLPVATYLVLPFVRFLGLSKFAVRLPFAVAGLFSILGIFLLGRIVFKNDQNKDKLSYWTAFLMVLSPWGIFLSRILNPELLGFVFFIFGLYFWLKREGIKNADYLISLIFLLLSLYSDKTSWFFTFPFFSFFDFF